MTKQIYNVADLVAESNSEVFYSFVRDYVVDLIDEERGFRLKDPSGYRELYKAFTYGFIVAVKKRDTRFLIDCLANDVNELYLIESLNGNSLELLAALRLLVISEMERGTGLAGMVEGLFPGNYVSHSGSDYSSLVLMCEV